MIPNVAPEKLKELELPSSEMKKTLRNGCVGSYLKL